MSTKIHTSFSSSFFTTSPSSSSSSSSSSTSSLHRKPTISSLKFNSFSVSRRHLNSGLLRQPEYKPALVSAPHEPESLATRSTDKSTSNDVLRLFDAVGVVVTPDVYASLVAECTRKRDEFQALLVYEHMKGSSRMVNYLKGYNGLFLFNRILLMFVICGCLGNARQVFDEMPLRNSVSLSVLIAALVDEELFDECLCLFVEMYECCCVYQGSYKALNVVVVCVLKACVFVKNVSFGRMVHSWLVKMGYGNELFVRKAFVEYYGKCRCLLEANRMFYQLVEMGDECDISLWTCAIVNNCRQGNFSVAIRIVLEMVRAGVTMNENTVSSVLRACGRVKDGSLGKQVHANAIKLGLNSHVFVMCGLIDMYGRCGLLNDARNVFDRIHRDKRSYACWNAMVTGLSEHGMWIEAIKMMYEMKAVGFEPKQSMVSEVMMSCGTDKFKMNSEGTDLFSDSIKRESNCRV